MSQKRKISRFRALQGGKTGGAQSEKVPPPAVFAQSVQVLLREGLKRVPGLTESDAVAILMRVAAERAIGLEVTCDIFVEGAKLVYLDELSRVTRSGA
jgi:hypothetical protein